MSGTVTTIEVPGYLAGTWVIDPVHTDVSFSNRHLMIGRVRGRFRDVSGTIVLAEDPLASSVTADIDVASLDTGNEQRDIDLRSPRFLDVERYPTMTFRSTGVRRDGDRFLVRGELDLHGVTRALEMVVEMHGFTRDPSGAIRAGFSAATRLNRRDFGITIDLPMDGGGVVVGDEVQVHIDVEAVLTSPSGNRRLAGERAAP